MPYVPLPNGETVFIEDPKEADQKYAEAWGVEVAKPSQLTTQVAAEDQQQQQQAGQRKPQGALDYLFSQTTAGTLQDTGKLYGEVRRKAINDPIATLQKIGAATQGIDLGAALAGGPQMAGGLTPSLEDPEIFQARQRNAVEAIDALQKTGKKPDGFSYGVAPDVPIVGPLLSEEGEIGKQLKPDNWVGELVTSIGAALQFDKGVNALIGGAPGLTTMSAPTKFPNLKAIFNKDDTTAGVAEAVKYVIKDVLPDTVQDAMFFAPSTSAALTRELEKVQKIESEEERIALIKILSADSDNDFNYAFEQGKAALAGASIIVGGRALFEGILKAGNKFLKRLAKGEAPDEALANAAKEAEPQTTEALERAALQKAYDDREARLGELYTQMNRRIEDTTSSVAYQGRENAEVFIKNQAEFEPELQRLMKEADETPDVGEELLQAQKRVQDLEASAGVSNPQQLQDKLTMLTKRIESYDQAIRKDPDWLKKSTGTGKGRTKNNTKYRKAEEALMRLIELDDAALRFNELNTQQQARQSAFARLDEALGKKDEMTLGFRNALRDARVFLNSIDQLNKERIQLLKARNDQFRLENRLNDINVDFEYPGAIGEVYSELQDLINGAEAAERIGSLGEDYMRQFVARIDEIENKLIDNGGLAPAVPEFPEITPRPGETEEVFAARKAEAEAVAAQTKTEGLGKIPETPAPVQTPVQVTKTETGDLAVDTNALAARRAAEAPTVSPQNVPVKTQIELTNKDLKRRLDPGQTEAAAKQFVDDITAGIKKSQELLKAGDVDAAIEQTRIFGTNAIRYATRFDNSLVLTRAAEAINREILVPQQYAIAIKKLLQMTGPNKGLNRIAEYIASGKAAQADIENFNTVMTTTAMIDYSAGQALTHSRDLLKVLEGKGPAGLDRTTALANFADAYEELQAGMAAIEKIFYAAGNKLRLLDRRNRLAFGEPAEILSAYNQELAKLGKPEEFAELISKATKRSKDEMDMTIGALMNKVKNGDDLTAEEIDGLQRLAATVADSGGNPEILKNLEVTQDAVLARIQINSPLSNPALLPTIPADAMVNGLTETVLRATTGYINGGFYKFVKGNTDVADEYFRQAALNFNTLKQMQFVMGEALETTVNRFIYGRAITDYNQSVDKAFDIRRTGGIRREEAINQDLAAQKLNIPFVNYVIERAEGDDKLFDTLNKARVLTKVFHDYFIPGEAWEKRGLMGKYVMGGTTTALRGMGFGKKSYYPGGENVNLSLFTQLTATGDEFSTALFANSHVRARYAAEVAEEISNGTLAKDVDVAEEITRRVKERSTERFRPIKTGFDQKVIGYAVLDDQILELTNAINLTEELTGPVSSAVEGMVNKVRQAQDPRVAAFGRHIFPFLVSPVNGIKRAVRLAYGGEIAQAGFDVIRASASTAAKQMPERMVQQLNEMTGGNFTKKIVDFESKYLSSDPKVRIKAQGALAISVGIQGLAFGLVMNGDQDISGGLENSYREAQGGREPYTWKIGGVDYPYRFLPIIGQAIAFQANLRDMQQFGTSSDGGETALAIAAVASQILEVPAFAGFEQVVKALTSAATGNVSRIQRMLGDSVSKSGDPYLNLRKVIVESFDPRKPASPSTRFIPFTERYRKTGKLENKDLSLGETVTNYGQAATNMVFGSLGSSLEYGPAGLLAEVMASIAEGDPEIRTGSRKAIWYGKPGATVNTNHAGVWRPFQAVLGRYWAFPNEMVDPVSKEMVENLIKPPSPTLFQSDGFTIDDTMLNNFNHFLNSELEYYDPVSDKTYKGAHSYLTQLVTSNLYKSFPAVDSPFKQSSYYLLGAPIASKETDWDRSNNARRAFLQQEVRKLITEAKQQFLMGELEGQRYKAPENFKQAVLQARNPMEVLN